MTDLIFEKLLLK